MFMRAFLTQLQRATAEGVPVNGYFYWSAMDPRAYSRQRAGRTSLTVLGRPSVPVVQQANFIPDAVRLQIE